MSNVHEIVIKIIQLVATHKILHERYQRSNCGADTVGDVYSGPRIRVLRLNLATTMIDATVLRLLTGVLADCVTIESAGLVKPESYRDQPIICTRSMWTLFAIDAVTAETIDQGVKHFVLDRPLSAAHLPRVYSLLATSPSVQTARIDPRIVDGKTTKKYADEVWQWIAYGVFCRGHTHPLRGLSLNVGSLRKADVKLIRDTLTAKDPIAELCSRAASLRGQTISASKFMLSEPKKTSEPFVCESTSVLTDLPLLKRVKPWTSVLLPAWGQAWVHDDDVVVKRSGPSGPFLVRGIAHIKLDDMNEASLGPAIDLLQLVRHGLRHVTLANINNTSDLLLDDWCAQLLDECPGLETLEISGMMLSSVDFLVDRYESERCHVTRFAVSMRSVATSHQSLARLIAALGDNTHPAAQCMSRFSFEPASIALLEDPVVAALLQVLLEQNQRLYDFEIGFRGNQHTYRALVEPFSDFNSKRISRPRAPLDAHQRLAFLSVVSNSSLERHQQSAMHQLDSGVLSVIFEMAATCYERRVCLRPAHLLGRMSPFDEWYD